jgi:hypothetical protein
MPNAVMLSKYRRIPTPSCSQARRALGNHSRSRILPRRFPQRGIGHEVHSASRANAQQHGSSTCYLCVTLTWRSARIRRLSLLIGLARPTGSNWALLYDCYLNCFLIRGTSSEQAAMDRLLSSKPADKHRTFKKAVFRSGPDRAFEGQPRTSIPR